MISTFDAKFLLPLRADGDVRVAAQRALFHTTRVDAEIEQDGAQLLHVEPRLFRRADVWLADDLHQRDARAVQVNQAVRLATRLALQMTTGVFLQVDARDADAAVLAVDMDHQVAIGAQRHIILRDLIALGQVGIEVVLAVELRVFGDVAVERERRHDGVVNRLLVDDRQRPRKPHTDGAVVGVRRRVGIVRRAAAEHLARGEQLRVDLQADSDLVLHSGFGRSGGHVSSFKLISTSNEHTFGGWRLKSRLRDAQARPRSLPAQAPDSGQCAYRSGGREGGLRGRT